MHQRELLEVIAKAKADKVTKLNLSFRRLTELPAEIGELQNLQTLYLNRNQLTQIPPELGQLKSLQKLDLDKNELSQIPTELGQLQSLQYLSLSGNKLSQIPAELGQLQNLQKFRLDNNQLSQIPAELAQLKILQTLNLSGNQLSQIPAELDQLQSLQTLNLSGNQLSQIPAEFGRLQNLQKLYLHGNQLSQIPTELGQLQSLQELYLHENQLSQIPTELGQLGNLQILWLHNTQLSQIPTELGRLQSLQKLYLHGNQLSHIPTELGQLQSLQELYLHENQLSQIPTELGQLQNLRKLWLNNNQLSQIPTELGQLGNLQILDLAKNQLSDELMAAYQQGIPAFKAYLQGLAKDGQKLYEAKVLFVGEGNVGKTCLREAMRGQDFISNRDSTHGIEIRTLSLPQPNGNKPKLKLNLWDFGGQPVYRITHQFFYSERSLYILVWSPREGVEKCDVEGWIERIQLRVGPEAQILIVSTHCDIGQRFARIKKVDLQERYGEIILGFYEVDSESGKGIQELKNGVALAASRLPHMGRPQSKSWNDAKNEIINLDCPQIPITRFNEICKKHELDDLATDTLANLMNDLGHLIYFSKDDGLKDILVLKPEWLTKAIGFVLEDPQTNLDAGILCHDRLDAIWRDHGIEGREQYAKEFHPYFLRLMEKFDVCYRLKSGDKELRKSLVTQLVPAEQPKELWTHQDDLPEDLAQLRLIFELDQSPPGLIPWLIVRTQRYTQGLHWQGGILLKYPHHGEALMHLERRKLSITTRSTFPNHFTSILREIIETLIHDRWKHLDFKTTIPCYLEEEQKPCTGTFPLKALYKARKKGRASVDCRDCYEDLDVSRLLSGFETPDLDLAKKLEEAKEQRDKLAAAASQEREDMFKELKQNQEMLYSQAAQYFRGLINAVSLEAESRCPSLYTLLPEKLEGVKNKGWTGHRVTFWCDFPGEEHPRCKIGSDGPGEYVFTAPGKWLMENAGKLKTLSTCLRLIIPMIAPTIEGFYEGQLEDEIKNSLSYMDKAMGTVAGEYLPKELDTSLDFSEESYVRRGRAENSLLSVLSDMLFKQDKHKARLGLRRMLDETGHYLWLCPKHAKVYDPGLPILS